MFSIVSGVLRAVRAYIRSVKGLKPKEIFHKSTSLCGNICITPLKCIRKEGVTFILAVVIEFCHNRRLSIE